MCVLASVCGTLYGRGCDYTEFLLLSLVFIRSLSGQLVSSSSSSLLDDGSVVVDCGIWCIWATKEEE